MADPPAKPEADAPIPLSELRPIGTRWDHPNNWSPRGNSLDFVHVRQPAIREAGLALCQAMAAWLRGQGPPPDIDTFIEAMRLNSRVLASTAGIALALVLAKRADAFEVLMRVFEASPAQSRALMLRFIRCPGCLPDGVVDALLDHALSDRSEQVRTFAGEAAERRDRKDLLPRLREMRGRARTDGFRESLEYFIPLIEKGYHAQWHPESNLWAVRISLRSGRASIWIPAAAVETMGMDGAVAHARERLDAGALGYIWDKEEGPEDG